MQTLICPSCGLEKNKNQFIGNICKNCYYKNNACFEINQKDIIICKSCGRLKTGFLWKPFSEDTFKELIRSNIKSNLNYKIKALELIFYKDKIGVNIELKVGKDKLEYNFTFTPKYQYCQECYKKVSGYFEALVQLRGFELSKDIYNIFLRLLRKVSKEELKKGNYSAYLQKVEQVNNGIDYYLGSKQLALAFIREIKNRFDIERKDSFKLVGMLPGGKEKVRYTYLVRKKDSKI